MKKRSLKIMSVVLAGVMTTGMILGGCSAGGDKENGGNKEASKELNLWMHNGQAFVDETKKLAENYEKETGVKINIQTFPYDAMSQKMKAAFTAGNEPDIMHPNSAGRISPVGNFSVLRRRMRSTWRWKTPVSASSSAT